MGRRTSLASLANAKVEEVPGLSVATLVRLRTAQIAATPLNPRNSFGSVEELADLGESIRVKQLQPVVVVSRNAYLKLWPEHAERIGDASHVLVNGERRYRAALQADVERLDAVHREELADSRAAFLDALLRENLDRKNFDPIEEANAVEAMVAELGSATAAAEQFRRHKTWVSQRRALLKLRPELQAKVRSGDLPVRIARSIAALPHDEQEDAWLTARRQEDERRREAAAARRSDREVASAAPAPGSGDTPPPVPTPRPAEEEDVDAPPPPRPAGRPAGTRPRASGAGEDGRAQRMPWDSLESLAELIRRNVPSAEIPTLVSLLQES
ncbi:ParB/RepB/Spo0J family partition protein [Actinomadura sediminis]|uniref:ParB/RepB/Spo0J family partition protein n=1 Tax=Actinomadura sediminis TaxID=1038904 RepID=A0ABW3EM68_9ACTN